MNKLNKIFMLLGTTAMLCSPMTVLAYEKNETVYTNLKYDGSIERITVSNHLSKLNKEDIQDETTLKNILDISGDEEYYQSDNKLTWKNNNSSEIFYQGITEQATPIEVEVKYYLNGEEKDLKDIEGKSGDIKIELKSFNSSNFNESYNPGDAIPANMLLFPVPTTLPLEISALVESLTIVPTVVTNGARPLQAPDVPAHACICHAGTHSARWI